MRQIEYQPANTIFRRAARTGVVCGLLVACIGCDQFTKHVAIARLKGQPAQSFCQDLVRLQYAENPGAFLGLGGQLPAGARWTILVLVNGGIASGIAAALVLGRATSGVLVAACLLLLAGALGNLIDRVRFDGLVIDFLNLGVGPLRTGIFNVADVAISLGALLLALTTFRPVRPALEPKL